MKANESTSSRPILTVKDHEAGMSLILREEEDLFYNHKVYKIYAWDDDTNQMIGVIPVRIYSPGKMANPLKTAIKYMKSQIKAY